MLKAVTAKDALALKYPHTLTVAKQIRCRTGFYTPPANFCWLLDQTLLELALTVDIPGIVVQCAVE